MPEQPGISIFTPSAPVENRAPAAPVERSTPRVASHTEIEGVRSNPTQAPWQERWDADQRALDRENPWRDTQNTIITKNPDGSLQVRQRGDARPNGAPNAGEPGQPQAPTGATSDGTKLRVGELELDEAAVRGIMERASLEQSRKANAPKDAADFDLSLPADFVMPPGVEWAFDTESPTSAALLGQAKQFAFEHGLDKTAFAKLLGLHASHQIAEAQQIADLQRVEREKLGANISVRVDAIGTWLESQLGSDLARAMRASLFTAKTVEGFERLMRNHSNQGVSGNPTGHRDPGANKPGRLSDSDYAKLTYAQKTAYAQQFDQREFNGG